MSLTARTGQGYSPEISIVSLDSRDDRLIRFIEHPLVSYNPYFKDSIDSTPSCHCYLSTCFILFIVLLLFAFCLTRPT